MSDNDNRINLSSPDFGPSGTGSTGQLHDEYPKGNTQARYDFMRSMLIGLLANQSSADESEPIEKRTGTLWYKKTSKFLDVFNGSNFVSLADHIRISTGETTEETLQSVLTSILSSLAYTSPRVVWSGIIINSYDQFLPVPEKFQGYAKLPNMRPFLYVDGLLVDPRDTTIDDSSSVSYIKIINYQVRPNQKYTVILQQVAEIETEDILGVGK
jgi:hypothetical protein